MANSSYLQSPVSPIQQSLPSIPSRNTSTPSLRSNVTSASATTAEATTAHSQSQTSNRSSVIQASTSPSNTLQTDWILFTLRWYFLIIPLFTSLAFAIALSIICWYSSRNYGLGKDHGSSSILFRAQWCTVRHSTHDYTLIERTWARRHVTRIQ
ncbi:hypothetical protein P280DRAFT_106885 [Massarina eburnea CBS 473.64]|uniref:Uncharacterized protein n=1 Tax=Massarina eburnea CBS 473.64 TaxID=1395130 RepID=A0A6A6RTX4_9PLEO|nr:hypothetical protein P280DRAFT_106885 [Massarina eburnea CBS 473.64]